MTIAELPEHVADLGAWKEWPRKGDAHLKWGVRQRQIAAFISNGKLRVFRCPDETLRLDPTVLRELFGEPDLLQGRDRDLSQAERRRKQSESAELAGDPVVLLANRQSTMLTDLHGQHIALLKGVSEPLTVLINAYKDALAARDARIASLEKQLDDSHAMRVELEDLKQERAARLAREQNSERRRDETLQLLKDQIPTLASTWLAGDTLSGFGKRAPRAVVEAIIESEAVSEQDAEILRRAAGIPKPAAQPNPQPNGMKNGTT